MTKKGEKKNSSKSKRNPSEYNIFIKAEREKGKSMAEAAHAWKIHRAQKTKPYLPPAHSTIKKRSPQSKIALEKTLTQNLVALQKINADLAEKFDSLSKQISSLLSLFEITAKQFTRTTPLGEYEKDKEFLQKIDKLLDQNKVLAKGLTLMEERLRERVYGSAPLQREKQNGEIPRTLTERPMPRF